MRRTLTALMITSLASGVLLFVATLSLDAWQWRLYNEAQAHQSSNMEPITVVGSNPYQSPKSWVAFNLPRLIACCAAATFWALFVGVPCLLVSRRLFSGTFTSQVIAAIVVCTVTGISFAFLHGVTPYISPLLIFAIGGSIGLSSIVLLAKMLPPNKSLERTRER